MRKIASLLAVIFILAGMAFAAGPAISAIAVASVTANSATITWTTSPAATSQIFFGVNGNTNLSTNLHHDLVTSHSLTLNNLAQQTVYTYEVQSTDSGGTTTSGTNTFALCNPGNANSGFTTVTVGENASYVLGTVTATWTDNSGVSTASPTLCGNTFATTPTGTVGLPGNLVMQLPDNNYIVPSPSSWIFTQSNASGLSANEAVNGPQIDFTSAFALQGSASAPGAAVWGSITGILSNQTDLQTALNAKAPLASPVFTTAVTLPASITLPATTTFTPASGVSITIQTPSPGSIGLDARGSTFASFITLTGNSALTLGYSTTGAFTPITLQDQAAGVKIQSGYLLTSTSCVSSASPAVCGANRVGTVAVPAGTNPTLVVDTSLLFTSSQIFLADDQSKGSTLSPAVTCNTTLPTGPIIITAITDVTSFTIEVPGVFTTNPVCVDFFLVN